MDSRHRAFPPLADFAALLRGLDCPGDKPDRLRALNPAPAAQLVAPGCSMPVQRALYQAPTRAEVDAYFARALPMAAMSRFELV